MTPFKDADEISWIFTVLTVLVPILPLIVWSRDPVVIIVRVGWPHLDPVQNKPYHSCRAQIYEQIEHKTSIYMLHSLSAPCKHRL